MYELEFISYDIWVNQEELTVGRPKVIEPFM
jgi:hypothetical protein